MPDVHALRDSAIAKLEVAEAAALLGPFVSETVNDNSRSGPREVRFLGPNGEEWTPEQWLRYVSERLSGTDDFIWDIIELSDRSAT